MQTAQSLSVPVAALDTDRRATFLTRTYTHLLFAILAFIGIEAFCSRAASPRPSRPLC